MMDAVSRFHRHIEKRGIPIEGISGKGPTCRIDFRPAATLEQKRDARREAETFDWSDKEPDYSYRERMWDELLGDFAAALSKTFPAIKLDQLKRNYINQPASPVRGVR